MVSIQSLLSAAVGFGAPNRLLDVKRIQILLNAVPPARGGPFPLLRVDGLCGPLSCGAIRRFQSANLGFADGVISPGQKSVMALTTILQGLGLLAQLLAKLPDERSGRLGPTDLRERIRLAAHATTLGSFGIVSDQETDTEIVAPGTSRTVRKGWVNLKKFFDESVEGWTEANWKNAGYLDGVKLPGKRVPQPGTPPGVQWCGIFAVWVWRQAGKSTKWRIGLGPNDVQPVYGSLAACRA